MYISPPLQKTDESSAIQHSVKVSANVPACMRACVDATLRWHPCVFIDSAGS